MLKTKTQFIFVTGLLLLAIAAGVFLSLNIPLTGGLISVNSRAVNISQNQVGSPLQISDTHHAQEVQTVSLGNGNTLAIWGETPDVNMSPSDKIWSSVYNPSTGWNRRTMVSSAQIGNDYLNFGSHTLVSDNNGNAYLFWLQADAPCTTYPCNNRYLIYLRKYTTAGGWGPKEIFHEPAAGYQIHLKLKANINNQGKGMLAWGEIKEYKDSTGTQQWDTRIMLAPFQNGNWQIPVLSLEIKKRRIWPEEIVNLSADNFAIFWDVNIGGGRWPDGAGILSQYKFIYYQEWSENNPQGTDLMETGINNVPLDNMDIVLQAKLFTINNYQIKNGNLYISWKKRSTDLRNTTDSAHSRLDKLVISKLQNGQWIHYMIPKKGSAGLWYELKKETNQLHYYQHTIEQEDYTYTEHSASETPPNSSGVIRILNTNYNQIPLPKDQYWLAADVLNENVFRSFWAEKCPGSQHECYYKADFAGSSWGNKELILNTGTESRTEPEVYLHYIPNGYILTMQLDNRFTFQPYYESSGWGNSYLYINSSAILDNEKAPEYLVLPSGDISVSFRDYLEYSLPINSPEEALAIVPSGYIFWQATPEVYMFYKPPSQQTINQYLKGYSMILDLMPKNQNGNRAEDLIQLDNVPRDNRDFYFCVGNNGRSYFTSNINEVPYVKTPEEFTGARGTCAVLITENLNVAGLPLTEGTITFWRAIELLADKISYYSINRETSSVSAWGYIIRNINTNPNANTTVDAPPGLYQPPPPQTISSAPGGDTESNDNLRIEMTGVDTMAVGEKYACVIHKEPGTNAIQADPQGGYLRCWGDNNPGPFGELNNLDVTQYNPLIINRPIYFAGPNVRNVTIGANHICYSSSLTQDTKCLGNNNLSALGNGQPGNSATQWDMYDEPQKVLGLPNGKMIGKMVAGTAHNCLLTVNNELYCWGNNSTGEIGDGTINDALQAVKIPGAWTDIAAGDLHTCGIKDNKAWCWGHGGNGQFGSDPNDIMNTGRSPSPIDGTEGAKMIASGWAHNCILTGNNNDTVKCWGRDFGSENAEIKPVSVISSLSGKKIIDLEVRLKTCVLYEDGSMACLSGFSGEQEIIFESEADMMAVGSVVCGQHKGVMKCQGSNYYGLLGHGFASYSLPENFGLDEPVSVCGGSIDRECPEIWKAEYSENGSSQNNNGTAKSSYSSKAKDSIGSSPATVLKDIDYMDAEGNRTCVIHKNSGKYNNADDPAGGYLRCWGAAFANCAPLPCDNYHPTMMGGPGVSKVTLGYGHACYSDNNNTTIKCFGDHIFGQLGNGIPPREQTQYVTMDYYSDYNPQSVLGLPANKNIEALEAGSYHTCAIFTGGSLYCWGNNDFGQIGDGTVADALSAYNVPGTWSDVSGGVFHTCGIQNNNAWCWGHGGNGQFGAKSDNILDNKLPSLINGTNGATAISASWATTCTVIGNINDNYNDNVWCWGKDYATETADPVSVTKADGLSNKPIKDINVYYNRICALYQDGSLRCQKGITSTQTEVIFSSGADYFAIGNSHTCVQHEGTVKCLGKRIQNESEQFFAARLGVGLPENNPPDNTPAAVCGTSLQIDCVQSVEDTNDDEDDKQTQSSRAAYSSAPAAQAPVIVNPVISDDAQASTEGQWETRQSGLYFGGSAKYIPFVNSQERNSSNYGRITWNMSVPAAGSYGVYIILTAENILSSKTPVEVYTDNYGSPAVLKTINQTRQATGYLPHEYGYYNGYNWLLLGNVTASQKITVKLSNTSDGNDAFSFVLADSVLIAPANNGSPHTEPAEDCGNSDIQNEEQCDDGNQLDNDGCSSGCQIESGYACSGEPSQCTPICGDGLVRTNLLINGMLSDGGETCDDNNRRPDDGCLPSCHTEPGYTCSGEPSVCQPICGDGYKKGNEECDDKDEESGDGCSNTCTIENGYHCFTSLSQPSVCTWHGGDAYCNADELEYSSYKQLNEIYTATGDFNNDGRADFATLDPVNKLVKVSFNEVESVYELNDQPTSLSVDDINGDIFDDIVVITTNRAAVHVLENTRDGRFKIHWDKIKKRVPSDTLLADFNNDNRKDILLTDWFSHSLYLTNDDFSFSPAFTFGSQGEINDHAVTAADLNGDQNLDVAIYQQTGNNKYITIYYGDGQGNFPTQKDISLTLNLTQNMLLGGSNVNLMAGDINNDSLTDLVLADPDSQSVHTLINQAGSFNQIAFSLFHSITGNDTKLKDVDLDGTLDITASGFTENDTVRKQIRIYFGNGDGTFKFLSGERMTITATNPILNHLWNDLNNDNSDELIAGRQVFKAISGCENPSYSPACPNGITEDTEQCDDNNTSFIDGCSSCRQVAGYYCAGSPSVCAGVCGDGKIRVNERCDDGNAKSGDGCSENCAIETGYKCRTQGGISVCLSVCGDGVIAGSEQCDDGDIDSNDGCSSDCQTESWYKCSGQPSVCTTEINGPYCNQNQVFLRENSVPTPIKTKNIKITDIDNDGQDDIIASLSDGIGITSGYQNHETYLYQEIDFESVNGFGVGDINNDNLADIIVSGRLSSIGNYLFLINNKGDGTFNEPVKISNQEITAGLIEIIDLNNDNKPELLLAGSDLQIAYLDQSNNVYLVKTLEHKDKATVYTISGLEDDILPNQNVTVNNAIIKNRVLAKDFDKDNYRDIAAVISYSISHDNGGIILPFLVVFYGDSNGSFSRTERHLLNNSSLDLGQIDGADTNKDGWIDLAVPDAVNKQILIFRGSTNGFSSSPVVFDALSDAGFVKFADVDGDDNYDLTYAVSKMDGSSVWVHFGNNAGTFRKQQGLYAYINNNKRNSDNRIAGFAWGNINADGLTELIVPLANRSPGYLVYNLENCIACGDGKVNGPESCDDLNRKAGDGCSASCQTETGWLCSGGSATTRSHCQTICNDGLITGAEQCDGNNLDGQTCASIGYGSGNLGCNNCQFNTSACTSTPVENIRFDAAGWQRIFNNTADSNDVSFTIAVTNTDTRHNSVDYPVAVVSETEQSYNTAVFIPAGQPGVATITVPGIKRGITHNYKVIAGGKEVKTLTVIMGCNDGVLEADYNEDCENGNLNQQTCQSIGMDSGTLNCSGACRFDTSGCFDCGNQIPEPENNEECDDGNNENSDMCTTECKEAACGDGYTQPVNNETCDAGPDGRTYPEAPQYVLRPTATEKKNIFGFYKPSDTPFHQSIDEGVHNPAVDAFAPHTSAWKFSLSDMPADTPADFEVGSVEVRGIIDTGEGFELIREEVSVVNDYRFLTVEDLNNAVLLIDKPTTKTNIKVWIPGFPSSRVIFSSDSRHYYGLIAAIEVVIKPKTCTSDCRTINHNYQNECPAAGECACINCTDGEPVACKPCTPVFNENWGKDQPEDESENGQRPPVYQPDCPVYGLCKNGDNGNFESTGYGCKQLYGYYKGLVWSPGRTSVTYTDAKKYCDSLPYCYGEGWRLPAEYEVTELAKGPVSENLTLSSPTHWATKSGFNDGRRVNLLNGEVIYGAGNLANAICVTEDLGTFKTDGNAGFSSQASSQLNQGQKNYLTVFVTSVGHKGDFGGITGADAFCQGLAETENLGGTYKAWLGGDTPDSYPAARFTRSDLSYYRTDGVKVADNWNDLTDGSLDNPINITEKGAFQTIPAVFTAVDSNGNALPAGSDCSGHGCNCHGWISANSLPAYTGQKNDTSYSWTYGYLATNACANSLPVYCFEQEPGQSGFSQVGGTGSSGGFQSGSSQSSLGGNFNPAPNVQCTGLFAPVADGTDTTWSATNGKTVNDNRWYRVPNINVYRSLYSAIDDSPDSADTSDYLTTNDDWANFYVSLGNCPIPATASKVLIRLKIDSGDGIFETKSLDIPLFTHIVASTSVKDIELHLEQFYNIIDHFYYLSTYVIIMDNNNIRTIPAQSFVIDTTAPNPPYRFKVAAADVLFY